jgi:hypothetical protein
MPISNPRATYCGPACKKRAYRARIARVPWQGPLSQWSSLRDDVIQPSGGSTVCYPRRLRRRATS